MKQNVVLLVVLFFLFHVSNVSAYYSKNTTDVNCGVLAACNQCLNQSGCGWCKTERKCQDQDSYCQSPLLFDSCPPFFSRDLAIGTVLIFLGGILTSGGGLGGGGVYIPILVLVLGLSPHVAVPLSKITIFGIGVGGFIVLSRKRHPKANRPLIDFDTAFLMEPMTLLGSILGVYMNILFPSYLIIIFLVIILGYNAYKTIGKGITLYKEEKKPVELQDSANDPLLAQISNPQLEEILDRESRLPWWQILVLGVLELGMLLFMLMKGGSGIGPKYIECGSFSYWILIAATIPYLIGFTIVAGKYLRRKHINKVNAEYKFLRGDVQWTNKKTIVLPIIFVMAGVAAGFLGIGAGLVVGPIFLEMGMVPQVAVATSSYMILFTSFSTTVQFLILGGLPWEDAVWYFFVGAFAAMIGQYGLAEFIKRYKKQAFINFLLGGLIALSVIMMGVLEGIDVVRDVRHHRPMGFNSICPGKN